jgi:serine/threonine-protein kinase
MIGRRFGNYRTTALLGEGGMGAVYLAEHPSIGRKVAIKVLRAELASDTQLLARFVNEARAANAIRHPNIIEILDSGTTDSGISYLVMELLEGEPLAARIKRQGRLAPTDAVAFAMQTASALGAAHAKGIVHRDLKPDNLYAVPDVANPGREHVKVLDFGIAKLQAKMSDDSIKTRTGTLMGTPVYMSPEQCLGTKDVDHRSDIYSLGIIVYEMLAGQPPFVSEGFGALVNMHLNQAPVALGQRVPGLCSGLEALVAKMLAKRPEDRQQSMLEVHAALAAAAGTTPITCAPSPLATDLRNGLGATVAAPPHASSQVSAVGPTTLSHITGEQSATGAVTYVPSARPWIVGGLVAGVAALGLVLALRGSPTAPAVAPTSPAAPVAAPAPPPPAPAAPARVRIQVESVPPGARIVRATDGVVLGTTPQTMELEASPGPLEIRLEKDGHRPTLYELNLTADGQASVALQPLAAEPRRAAGGRRKRVEPASGDYEPAKL